MRPDRIVLGTYSDENGLRAMAEVETGFEAGGFVEILSGLEEGDAVILK